MNQIIDKPNIKLIFAKNITELMSEFNKTRRDLCSDLDLKYTTVCDWVNGRTLPRSSQLERLGNYFGIKAGDFFIDMDSADRDRATSRLARYSFDRRMIDMRIINHMSDEQIRDLLNSGYSFAHKTLEEYIADSGAELIASEELDWGEPVGSEIW